MILVSSTKDKHGQTSRFIVDQVAGRLTPLLLIKQTDVRFCPPPKNQMQGFSG